MNANTVQGLLYIFQITHKEYKPYSLFVQIYADGSGFIGYQIIGSTKIIKNFNSIQEFEDYCQ